MSVEEFIKEYALQHPLANTTTQLEWIKEYTGSNETDTRKLFHSFMAMKPIRDAYANFHNKDQQAMTAAQTPLQKLVDDGVALFNTVMAGKRTQTKVLHEYDWQFTRTLANHGGQSWINSLIIALMAATASYKETGMFGVMFGEEWDNLRAAMIAKSTDSPENIAKRIETLRSGLISELCDGSDLLKAMINKTKQVDLLATFDALMDDAVGKSMKDPIESGAGQAITFFVSRKFKCSTCASEWKEDGNRALRYWELELLDTPNNGKPLTISDLVNAYMSWKQVDSNSNIVCTKCSSHEVKCLEQMQSYPDVLVVHLNRVGRPKEPVILYTGFDINTTGYELVATINNRTNIENETYTTLVKGKNNISWELYNGSTSSFPVAGDLDDGKTDQRMFFYRRKFFSNQSTEAHVEMRNKAAALPRYNPKAQQQPVAHGQQQPVAHDQQQPVAQKTSEAVAPNSKGNVDTWLFRALPNPKNDCWFNSLFIALALTGRNMGLQDDQLMKHDEIGRLWVQLVTALKAERMTDQDLEQTKKSLQKQIMQLLTMKGRYPFNMVSTGQQDVQEAFVALLSTQPEGSWLADATEFESREKLTCKDPKCKSFRYGQLNTPLNYLPIAIQRQSLPANQPAIELTTLLEEYLKPELMLESKCEKCKQTGVLKQDEILSVPKLLVIQLGRFRDSGRRYVPFPHRPVFERLGRMVTSTGRVQIRGNVYEQVAMINHHGYSIHTGHYTATVKGRDGNFLEVYNDHASMQASKVVRRPVLQGWNSDSSYMLFFKCIEAELPPDVAQRQQDEFRIARHVNAILAPSAATLYQVDVKTAAEEINRSVKELEVKLNACCKLLNVEINLTKAQAAPAGQPNIEIDADPFHAIENQLAHYKTILRNKIIQVDTNHQVSGIALKAETFTDAIRTQL